MEDGLTRRDFLKAAAAGVAAASLPGRALAGSPNKRPPNVIFLFSDEHRWPSMSFTDMPPLRTPNMKRMADEGASFRRCISNYPVCSPYRAMLMTGRWPFQQKMLDQSPGMIDNGFLLSPHQMTLARTFQEAHYATGYIGKWHLGGDRAEPFGFDLSLVWNGTNDHWASSYVPKEGTQVKAPGYNATLMTDQALRFIDEHRKHPFFLAVSWNPPHANFLDAPGDKKALYPEGSLPFRPNYQTAQREPSTDPEKTQTSPGKAWSIYQGYHAHISAIDDELGRILDKIDALNLKDDTIIVYTSDHGSMQGSHGVGGKRQPYDESILTPFLVQWPGHVPKGLVPGALFGAIDVMPTLIGLAGLSIPGPCVGHDFSPTLRGEKGPEPASQFLMHIAKENASGGANHPAPLFRGVTTGHHTYAVVPDRQGFLFDNVSDPYQMNNLFEDPGSAQARQELHEMLRDWLVVAEDPFQMPAWGR